MTFFGHSILTAYSYWIIGYIYEAGYSFVVVLPVLLAETAPQVSAVDCANLLDLQKRGVKKKWTASVHT